MRVATLPALYGDIAAVVADAAVDDAAAV